MLQCGATRGTRVVNGSWPSDRVDLEAEEGRVSERLQRLEEAIGELEGAQRLRPDAAARLAKYRESHERLLFARRTLAWKLEASQPQPESDSTSPPIVEELAKRAKSTKERQRWVPS
jgi:hypothetical protein